MSESDLRDKISIQQTTLYPFPPRHYLEPLALKFDIKRIESFYQAHGYFDARVVSTDIHDRKNKKSVDVSIVVEEGPATRVESIQINGLEPLGKKADIIWKNFGVHKGDVFNHDIFVSEVDEIDGRLKELGYAWATVQPAVTVNRDATTANIVIAVTPGTAATLGKIDIQGEYKVNPRKIAIHSGLETGQPFSPTVLENARAKVYNLGVFASVKVDYQHDPKRPDVADVVITVKEGTFHQLQLGGGVGLEFERMEVRLRAIYTRNNFLGGLRTLKLKLEPAYVTIPTFWNIERQGPAITDEVVFTQPDAIFKLDQLKLTIGYDLGIDYAYQDHGPHLQVAYGRPFFHDRLQLSVSYNFQYLMFFNTDPAILQDPSRARLLFGYTDPYRVGWWQEDFALDLRDKPLDPRKGGYLAVRFEEGGVYAGGAFKYEKIQPDLRGYAPLGRRVVVAARVQAGQIFVQGDLGSPITRRFYMGGPDSHRGFNYNRLSLQAPSGLCGVPAIPIGGDQMFLGQIELRVQIVKLFGYWLEVANFLDAGDVAAPKFAAGSESGLTCPDGAPIRTSPNVNLANLHYAVGGGLRYKTIVGTIRVDIAGRLNRLAPCEADHTPNPDPGSKVAFHISIGEPF